MSAEKHLAIFIDAVRSEHHNAQATQPRIVHGQQGMKALELQLGAVRHAFSRKQQLRQLVLLATMAARFATEVIIPEIERAEGGGS
jgi:hypothetical protein